MDFIGQSMIMKLDSHKTLLLGVGHSMKFDHGILTSNFLSRTWTKCCIKIITSPFLNLQRSCYHSSFNTIYLTPAMFSSLLPSFAFAFNIHTTSNNLHSSLNMPERHMTSIQHCTYSIIISSRFIKVVHYFYLLSL